MSGMQVSPDPDLLVAINTVGLTATGWYDSDQVQLGPYLIRFEHGGWRASRDCGAWGTRGFDTPLEAAEAVAENAASYAYTILGSWLKDQISKHSSLEEEALRHRRTSNRWCAVGFQDAMKQVLRRTSAFDG